MAITRDEYDRLRAEGVSHEDIAAGRYQKQPGFFESTVKAVPNLVVKAGTRLGQAIAGAGIQAFGTEEQKARMRESLARQTDVPSALGGFSVNPVQSGRQVVGEAVQDAATIASAAFAPAVKPAVGIGRGIMSGARAAAPLGAGLSAAQELGGSISQGRGFGETVGRTVGAGIAGGVGAGVFGGILGGVAGGIAAKNARTQELLKIFQDNPQDSRVAQYAKVGATRILGRDKLVIDRAAKEAIDAGLDNASVAVYKGASKTDKAAFSKMLDIFEKGKSDAKFRALNRPSDVVGEPVIAQAKTLLDTLKTAGKELDGVAESLRGNTPNISGLERTFASFDDDLARIGASAAEGKIDFAGSDFDGLPATGTIEKVYRRILASRDALDLHRAKRYIDTLVEYGGRAEGLPGEAEAMLKGWRRSIDGLLDQSFPAYNKVNTKLSTAFSGLDALGDIAGTRFKATDEFAAAKIGQIARGILSNSRNRTDLLTRLNEVQKAATALGHKAEDDIVSRVLFFDDMERLLGTMAPTGLQGQATRAIDQALDTGKVIRSAKGGGLTGGVIAAGEKIAAATKGDPKEIALRALRALVSGN